MEQPFNYKTSQPTVIPSSCLNVQLTERLFLQSTVKKNKILNERTNARNCKTFANLCVCRKFQNQFADFIRLADTKTNNAESRILPSFHSIIVFVCMCGDI